MAKSFSDGLTDKQRKFVDEYLIDQNATQAAIRAGYSEKTARAIGHENLTKPDISHAIHDRLREHRERCEVTIDSLTEELSESRDLALKTSQASAAVSATLGKAKLHGLLIEKQEQKITADLGLRLSRAKKRLARDND